MHTYEIAPSKKLQIGIPGEWGVNLTRDRLSTLVDHSMRTVHHCHLRPGIQVLNADLQRRWKQKIVSIEECYIRCARGCKTGISRAGQPSIVLPDHADIRITSNNRCGVVH